MKKAHKRMGMAGPIKRPKSGGRNAFFVCRRAIRVFACLFRALFSGAELGLQHFRISGGIFGILS